MSVLPTTLAPETAVQMREIAQQVFEERQQEFLEAWKREGKPRRRGAAEWPNWVETTLRELTEAQKRTEDRVGELAEAQMRTEARLERLEITVQELAEAQKRTEARLEELAEAQKRTEARLEELAKAQMRTTERLDGMDRRLGRMDNLLGLDIEVDAQDTLTYVLEQKGYRLLEPPRALDLDGEIDIVLPVETPTGERLWVLSEVKARARFKELRRWAQRLDSENFVQRLEDQGVTRPFLFYLFGLRVYQIVEEEARRLGLGVLDPNGERVAPTPIR